MDCCKAKEFGAGIVLYFMLSKSTPFLAPTPQKTIEKTMEGKAFVVCGMSLEQTASHLSRSLYRWGDTWIHHDHFEHYLIWVGLRR